MNRYERHLKANPPKRSAKQPPPGAMIRSQDILPGFIFKLKDKGYDHETWTCVRRDPHPTNGSPDLPWVSSPQRGPCDRTPDGLWCITRDDWVLSI